MKCKICGEELELFGYNYIFKNGFKWKQTFKLCGRHIPYTSVHKTNEEKIE